MDILTLNESVRRLGQAIINSDKSFLAVHKARQRIDIHSADNIYFLTKGNISAHSCIGGYLMVNIFAEEVIGLEKLRGLKIISHLRCITDVEMHVISRSDAIELFDTLNLWPNAFDNLLKYMNIFSSRDSKINQPSARDTVIEYIKYIWTLRPAQRDVTSVYTFVLARTPISRSLIHKVIAELESKNKIVVRRGIIIECYLE